MVQLLRHSLDGYAYASLDKDERRRWEQEFETNEEGAFCRLFRAEKIPPHLGEFLDYFMVRKVIAGQELLKASGTVTGKLARWLADRGYIDQDTAADATDRARDAARDLPTADRLGMLLYDTCVHAPPPPASMPPGDPPHAATSLHHKHRTQTDATETCSPHP